MTRRRRMLSALGETELEVLQIVWQLGRATVADVLKVMLEEREVAYTTVMTVMRKLAGKGYLSIDDSETSFVYAAARRPDEVRHDMLKDVIDQVFQGSPAALVQMLVSREQLSQEELEEMRRLLEELNTEDGTHD